MGAETKIEWTHHTFNPWIGCTPVHTGCKNCYAEAQNLRWKYNGGTWGKGEPRKVTSASSWKQPLKWAREAAKAGERRRVFCASLADVLDLEAPPDAQARLWDLIRETVVVKPVRYLEPQDLQRFGGLDWLLLTKRPERWQIIPSDVRPLVWLGTSISDQLTADVWGPRLMRAQGFAKRFLSIEPQVGPIDLDPMLPGAFTVGTSGLDWVICGGESGPNARPFDLVWAYSLREQCRVSGIAFFCKQLGSRPMLSAVREHVEQEFEVPGGRGHFKMARFESEQELSFKDSKGGDWSEWPERLRVREFPGKERPHIAGRP
jgi:protein gp37